MRTFGVVIESDQPIGEAAPLGVAAPHSIHAGFWSMLSSRGLLGPAESVAAVSCFPLPLPGRLSA